MQLGFIIHLRNQVTTPNVTNVKCNSLRASPIISNRNSLFSIFDFDFNHRLLIFCRYLRSLNNARADQVWVGISVIRYHSGNGYYFSCFAFPGTK